MNHNKNEVLAGVWWHHAYNSNTWEEEEGRSGIQGQPGLMRPCLKNKQTKNPQIYTQERGMCQQLRTQTKHHYCEVSLSPLCGATDKIWLRWNGSSKQMQTWGLFPMNSFSCLTQVQLRCNFQFKQIWSQSIVPDDASPKQSYILGMLHGTDGVAPSGGWYHNKRGRSHFKGTWKMKVSLR